MHQRSLPLDNAASRKSMLGVRVLDLGTITAGASTSALLADAGAEVIKIEAPRRPDPFRKWSAETASSDVKSSPVFDFSNRNKYGLGLDLKQEAGRQLFLDMVSRADIVVENFRRGVMDKLGISFRDLQSANPAIVLASISSQGETGPEKNYTSFGSTLEAISGMAALTGYEDGPPVVTGRILNYPDQIVGIFAMGMIVTAVTEARRNGRGIHLDISQSEVTTFVIGEYLGRESGKNGSSKLRLGNKDPAGRLQFVAKSADGDWIAATAISSAQEIALSQLAGTVESLRSWVAEHSTESAIGAIAATGAAVARVEVGSEVMASLRRYGSSAFDNCPDGQRAKGFPFQSRNRKMAIKLNAPTIGHDTRHVLERVLDLSDNEIAELYDRKVVA